MSLSSDWPGHILHDDEGFLALFADFVNGADVGVLNGGGHAGFAQDGGAHLLLGEGAALEDLEHDGAHELGVVGEVDDAAAAGAELAGQLIVGDGALHLDSV